jgi:hypothetical protein
LRQNQLKNPFKNPMELMHKNRYQKKKTQSDPSAQKSTKKRSSFPGIDKENLHSKGMKMMD